MAKMFRQTDEDYFALGVVHEDKQDLLVVSNSLIKKIVSKGLHEVLTNGMDEEISDELQKRFNIGSATHCRILEPKAFSSRYYVADKPSSNFDLIRIAPSDFDFIPSALENIEKKYPEMLDGENVEMTITFTIDGVKCKSKLDKIVQRSDGSVDIYDLKTTFLDFFKLKQDKNGDRWELRRKLNDYGYDLQAYFYTRAVEELLKEQGGSSEVRFHFLMIGTDNGTAQMFTAGSEMMQSGEEKFNSVWSDIVDFSIGGKSKIVKEIVL